MGRVRLVMLTKITGELLLIKMLMMMERQQKRYLQHDRQQQDCYYSAYMLQLPHRSAKIQKKLIILPCLSVKPIDEGLDLEQPFKESEVRDSECLVAEAWLLLTAGILLLPPPLRGRPGGARGKEFPRTPYGVPLRSAYRPPKCAPCTKTGSTVQGPDHIGSDLVKSAK